MTDSGAGDEITPDAAEFAREVRLRRRSVGPVVRVVAAVVIALAVLAGVLQVNSRPVAAGAARADGRPVFVHYLPWFSTPTTLGAGKWGWHWTMDTRDPNVVDADGRRQIASHDYPTIGPYDSADPAVLRYHLLLMKYAGVDGVLVDWYGTAGTNADLTTLQRNAELLVQQATAIGMPFALVYEDRFARGADDVRTSLAYARDHYFSLPGYIRLPATGKPYLGVFGPITVTSADDWRSIVDAIGPVDLRTLWNNDAAGAAADGQFSWPYSSGTGSDWAGRLQNYYALSTATGRRVTGVGFPGFDDYYAEGETNGKTLFTIPANGVATLQQTLALAAGSSAVDSFQIATWNDFGEGTEIEPTVQQGFRSLVDLQRFTDSKWRRDDLRTVLRWYGAEARGDTTATQQAYMLLVQGKPAQARAVLTEG